MLVIAIFTLILTALLTFLYFNYQEDQKQKLQAKQTQVLAFSEIETAAKKSEKVPNPAPTKAPKANKNLKKQKVKDTFTHENLLANLKLHSHKISSISLSENEKFLAMSSVEDRTVSVWPLKFVNKGNLHAKLEIAMDRCLQLELSPDGKAVACLLDFNNSSRIYSIQSDASSIKINSDKSIDLPCLEPSLNLTQFLFSYACHKRNTVKEAKVPFLVSVYNKPHKKDKVFITNISGQNLSNSQAILDPAVNGINFVKTTPKFRNVVVIAGNSPNLKFYKVFDDKFEVKKLESISDDSNVINFAFDGAENSQQNLAILYKKFIKIYQFPNSSDGDFEIKKLEKKLDFSVLEREIFEPISKLQSMEKLEFTTGNLVKFYENFLFIAFGHHLVKFDVNTEKLVEIYENIAPIYGVSDLKIAAKRGEIYVACGKICRVLKI